MSEHKEEIAKADSSYQKSVAPIIERYNKRRVLAIKKASTQTTDKLNRLIKDASLRTRDSGG